MLTNPIVYIYIYKCCVYTCGSLAGAAFFFLPSSDPYSFEFIYMMMVWSEKKIVIFHSFFLCFHILDKIIKKNYICCAHIFTLPSFLRRSTLYVYNQPMCVRGWINIHKKCALHDILQGNARMTEHMCTRNSRLYYRLTNTRRICCVPAQYP